MVTIQNCLFAHNHSLHLSVASNRAPVLLQNSLFTDTFNALNLIAHSCIVHVVKCNFYNNHGSAISASLSNTTVYFVNTSIQETSYISGQLGAVDLACLGSSEVVFENIVIANNSQTGIVSNGCLLIFIGHKSTIQENWSTGFGGGILLSGSHSHMSINQHSSLTLANNIAPFGGGIYCNNTKKCPFGKDDTERIVFHGNCALMSGNDIFGLSSVLCSNWKEANQSSSLRGSAESQPGDTHSKIRVCFCHNNEVDCSRRVHYHHLYSPYDSVEVSLGIVGPRGELLPPNITTDMVSFVTTEGKCAVMSLPFYCS